MPTVFEQSLLCAAVLGVAILYSSVGHGGASGYLAVLSLLSFPKETSIPSALILNVLVSGTAFVAFKRAGHFQWKLALPFILGSVPAAYIGGSIHISNSVYSILLAASLGLAAFRISLGAPLGVHLKISPRHFFLMANMIGLSIGFISGMIGIGGGIFLSPILLLAGWADAKQTAAVSSGFILVNSMAALLGQMNRGAIVMPLGWIHLALFAFAGGWIGSRAGADYFSHSAIRRLLSLVLWIASFKLIYSAFK